MTTVEAPIPKDEPQIIYAPAHKLETPKQALDWMSRNLPFKGAETLIEIFQTRTEAGERKINKSTFFPAVWGEAVLGGRKRAFCLSSHGDMLALDIFEVGLEVASSNDAYGLYWKAQFNNWSDFIHIRSSREKATLCLGGSNPGSNVKIEEKWQAETISGVLTKLAPHLSPTT